MKSEWERVDPPDTAPVHSAAERLGLPEGLDVDENGGPFRCDCCNRMTEPGAVLVWVPDGVRPSDPIASVTEIARRSAFNGTGSGWCLKCCGKWIKARRGIADKTDKAIANAGKKSLWRRILSALGEE